MKNITQERLKELVSYDKETGLFTRLTDVNYNAKKGDSPTSYSGGGYKQICIDGAVCLQHRLAFLYMTGSMPIEVDHINHNRGDNSWDNLRGVDQKEQKKNMKKRVDNTSGVQGVSWGKNRWVAYISIDGRRIHLGNHIEFSDAVNARKNAEILYRFHENHGGEYNAY